MGPTTIPGSSPVAADYSLYDPSYVASGSSEGLAGYLVDVDGSISKFFI